MQPNITNVAYDPTDIYGSPAYDVNALNAQGHCCNPLSNPNVTPAESSIAIATANLQAASDLAVSLGPPTVVSVTPDSGAGSTQTFSAVYSDPNGIGDVNNVRLLLNPAINGVDGCYVFYYPRINEMFLGNDGDNGIIGPLTPGSSSSIANNQCTLYGAGSSVTKSGNKITVNFGLAFASTYTGSKNIYLEANSAGDSSAGASSDWVEMGTWTP